MIPEKVISAGRYRQVLLLYNLLFVAVWFLSNQGLSFWDDFSYLSLANDINQGDFEVTTNHFTSRVTVLYPVAYVIKYLGISEYTTVIYPLFCGLTLLNLFAWLGHRINRWIGIIGAGLVLCDYHLNYFSNHLFPEMPMALMVFVVLMSYFLVLKNEMVPRMAGLLAALALFGAFLTKATVVLLLPLLIYLFVLDRRKHRNGSFWLVFVSLTIFFFLLNGFWYLEVKGSFFYRFQNIADNHVATAKSFFDKGASTILARLTYLPLLGFLKGGFFIPLLVALPAMIKLRKSHFKLDKAEHLWPVAALFLLAAFWFFSTSWRFYSPLPTDPRHIVFFIPVFIMTAATFWPEQKLFLNLKKQPIAIALIMGFLAIPVYYISQSGKKNFKAEESIISMHLAGNEDSQIVITDGLTEYGHPYFYQFNDVEDEYFWFSELSEEKLRSLFETGKPMYLLVNRAYFNQYYNDTENFESWFEFFARYNEMVAAPMAQEGEVSLYFLYGGD